MPENRPKQNTHMPVLHYAAEVIHDNPKSSLSTKRSRERVKIIEIALP